MAVLGRPFALATQSLLLCLWVACSPPRSSEPTGTESGRCIDHYDPTADYFPDRPQPRYAERFTVEYHKSYKVVTVTLPDETPPFTYLLVRCGTPRPEGFGGAVTIEVPVRSVVTTSTTELPHLVELDLLDALVGHDELDYVSSPEVRRKAERGEIAEVGRDSRLNFELLLALDPDLVLAASIGSHELGIFTRLQESGIHVAHVPSFLETTPLGRAEWILFTALFFNRENRAEEIFGKVAERYAELRRRGATVETRPTVLVGGPLGDTWYVPGGRSFIAQMIADAGGTYLWADVPKAGSVPLALESVYERAVGADYWIQPNVMASLAEIRAVDERLATLGPFLHQRVYANDARLNDRGPHGVGGNDYWESGTLRPDLVLADLLKILHPELVPEHELTYHRRLDDG